MSAPKKTTSVTFSVKSTPFIDDPDNAGEYYEALGRAIFLWGRFENGFNMCLMIVRNIPGGDKLMPEFPLAWKRKAQTWRKAFNTLPELAEWKANALRLITDATDTAQERHALFHGDWGEFTSDEPLTAQLTTWKHKGKGYIIGRREVSIDHLHAFAAEADRLNTRLVPYMWNLSMKQKGWPVRTKKDE